MEKNKNLNVIPKGESWALNTIEKSLYKEFWGQINTVLHNIEKPKFAIWGAGFRGMVAGMILEDLGEEEFVYIDSDPARQGKFLAGHEIKSFKQITKIDTYIMISMEICADVKDMLVSYGMKNEKDFCELHSNSEYALIEKALQQKENRVLVCGEGVVHIVPMEERETPDLEELLEGRYAEGDIKILGMVCVGLKNLYYLIRYEIEHNKKLGQLVLIMDFIMMTSYNHLLPRTQKSKLLSLLMEQMKKEGSTLAVMELEEACRIAKQREQNYELENRFSPKRIDTDQIREALIKNYFDLSDMENLDEACESIQYLRKILELTENSDIHTILVLQPMNMELSQRLNIRFMDIYNQKVTFLKKLTEEYHASFSNATQIVGESEFINTNRPGNAMHLGGRQVFAEYILNSLTESEN